MKVKKIRDTRCQLEVMWECLHYSNHFQFLVHAVYIKSKDFQQNDDNDNTNKKCKKIFGEFGK